MRVPGFLLSSPRGRSGLPRFLALTDPKRAADPYLLLANLPKNAGLVWRAYDEEISRSQLRNLSKAAQGVRTPIFLAWTNRHRATPLPDHRHLPEHCLNKPYTDGMFKIGRRIPPQTFITAAAHSERAIVAAAHAGVDAVLISPVFPTRSHPGNRSLGIIRFAALARLARSLGLAVYALGGINDVAKIHRLASTGATGIAGIDIFLANDQA